MAKTCGGTERSLSGRVWCLCMFISAFSRRHERKHIQAVGTPTVEAPVVSKRPPGGYESVAPLPKHCWRLQISHRPTNQGSKAQILENLTRACRRIGWYSLHDIAERRSLANRQNGGQWIRVSCCRKSHCQKGSAIVITDFEFESPDLIQFTQAAKGRLRDVRAVNRRLEGPCLLLTFSCPLRYSIISF